MEKVYETAPQTAKRCRQILKEAFPNTKFSVRSHRYAGGSSVDIRWNNGPTKSDVNDLTNHLAGATFDGLTDSMNYKWVELDVEGEKKLVIGADFIFCHRTTK